MCNPQPSLCESACCIVQALREEGSSTIRGWVGAELPSKI